MRARRLVLGTAAALVAAGAASASCSSILGLEPPPTGDAASAGEDSGVPLDATTGDAAGEAAVPEGGTDAASEAAVCLGLDAGDGSTTYYTFANAVIDDAGTHPWTYFEPSNVNTLSRDFQGGAFDGRYVYFAPNGSGTVTRYDTHGSFTTFASWTTFDTTTLSPNAAGFDGAVFDGRYVYFVPGHSAAGYTGVVARFDTTMAATFTAGAPAWSTFDMGTLPVPDGGLPTVGFGGATFDGEYVYFAPYYDGTVHLSRAVRYNPEGGPPSGPLDAGEGGAGEAGTHDGGDAGPSDGGAHDAGDASIPEAGSNDAGDAGPPAFAVASQFSTYDLSTRNANAAGFLGALFDGQSVYTVPYGNNAGSDGVVMRYAIDAGFTSSGSWTPFDLTDVSADAIGFMGAAFDGRFVYLVPHVKTIVARFDTQSGNVATKNAWSTFDISTVTAPDAGPPSYSGGAFDGRFIYFVPNPSATGANGVVRYDTWSSFTSPCAWSLHDTSQDVAAATDYYGAVYDGQYLYLVTKGTWVARYETKSNSAMPPLPAFYGSFY
ncbi:MAG: hypothetical protein ABSE49_19060 [Polyangiaceae bacterium]